MVMLFVLGFVLLIVAGLLLTSALASDEEQEGVGKSLAVLEAMTTAPSELRADLERPFAERVLEPLQARALRLGRRLSGNDSAERLRRKLDLAGNPGDWSPDRVISFKVIGAFSLTFLGLALALVAGASPTVLIAMTLGGLVLGFFVPDLYLYQTAYNRAEQIESSLPDAIDLLTISVEAGLAFDAALQQVARNTDGALAQEFSRVLREMQIGQSRSDALRALSERTSVDNLKTFVGAMVQADAFGIPIANVLRVQSSEMRVKRRQRAETKAQQVPVKMTVPLIFNVLPALFVAIIGPAILSVIGKI